MYQIEEIALLVKQASKKAMEADKEARQRANYENISILYGKEYTDVIPNYYEGYREVVEDYMAIRVHADKGCFPAQLFAKRAPNQTEKAANWMKDNYKNVTNPVFLDFLNTTLRCTHDQNWSITFAEDAKELVQQDLGFKKYLDEGIDIFGSIETFFKQVMFSLQLQDAMGVIAIKPNELPLVEQDGQMVFSSTELIAPQPHYYTCRQVVSNSQKYYLIETDKKSVVDYGNTKKEIGRVYEFYDDTNIYIATQIGKYVDNQFEITLYYPHEWGKVPVRRFGGMPYIVNGQIIYKSQFLFATDLLDLVAQNSAYKQASIAKCVFPATVMLGDVCTFESEGHRCNDGRISYYEGERYVDYSCPNCHGTGLVSRLGALETLLLKPDIRGQNESELTRGGAKPLEYISPEVHTLEFLSKEIDKAENKARAILHLRTSNSEVKGGEDMTATGMALDMKAAFAFILPIAHRAFDNFEFVIEAMGWQRYKNNFNKPTIVPPQSFDIGTERDILMTISEMVKSGVPAVLIQAEILHYIQSVFYSDAKTSSVYTLMAITDRLLVLSSEDIILRQSKGLAENWEVILHDSFFSLVDTLVNANEAFFEQDIEIQKTQVIDLAKQKASDIMESNKTELVDVYRGNN